MSGYNTIGLPNLGNGFAKQNVFNQMEKIAPKRFTAPGSSSIDRARRKVYEVVKTVNDREEQDRRYKEFIEKQRKDAEEIRKRRIREQDEAIAAAEAEKKKREEEEKKAIEKADKDYEHEFQQWVEELAKYNNDYKGRLAKSVIKSQQLHGSDYNPTYDMHRSLLKGMYNINNTVGDLLNDATGVHIQTLSGKISYNDLKKYAANAHKQMIDYQRNLNVINEQKELLKESLNGYKNSPDYDVRYKNVMNQIGEYNNQINEIKSKMNDPTLKELDDEYKINYVTDHGGLSNIIGGLMYDSIKELSIGSDKQKENLKKSVKQSRKNKILSDYDQMFNNRANYYENDYSNTPDQNNNTRLVDALSKPKHQLQFEFNQKRLDTDNKFTQDAINQIDLENNEYSDEIKRTAKQQDALQDYFHVAKSYLEGKQANQNAWLFSPNYWFYVAPGMIGSSNSSWDQIVSNAIQYGSLAVGAAVSALGQPEIGAGVVNLGGLLATPGQIKGGFDENYAEIGDKRSDTLMNAINMLSFFNNDPKGKKDILGDLKRQSIKFWKEQGRSDEWIKKNYMSNSDQDYKNAIQDYIAGFTKNNDPRLQQVLLNSTKGLKAQFWADNARTMGEMPVQLAMNFLPTKPISKYGEVVFDKAGSKILSSKLTNKIVESKAGKVLAKVKNNVSEKLGIKKAVGETEEGISKYSNGFRRPTKTFKERLKSGYETGSEVGESLGFGYGGRIAFGASGAAIREAAHLGGKLLTPEMKELLKELGERSINTYQKLYDKLLPKDWMRIAARYGMNATRRGIMQAASEGAEEGVQYLNSKEDYASKYGFGGMSLGDLIANDFAQGGRVAKAYLSMMGIGKSELDDDLEFWQNVKGGFALGGMGGFHPGQIINFYGNVKNAYNQYTTDQFIRNSAIMNREKDKLDRAANVDFAKMAMNNKESEVIESMSNMYKNDRRRQNPYYTQDDYDDKIQAAHGVMSMTKDETVRQKLEAKGIKFGTEEYAIAVADLYNLQQQLKENQDQSNQNIQTLDKLYNSKEFDDALDDIVKAARSGDISIDLALSQKRVKAGNEAVAKAIEEAKKEGKDVNNPEFNLQLEKIRKEAQDAAEKEGIGNYRSYIKQKTALVNKLKALLKYKGQQNTAEEFFNFLSDKLKLKTKRPDAKTILDVTTKQIQRIKQQLKELDPELDLGKTDADLLNAINNIQDIVNLNEEDIQQAELNSIAMASDRAVTLSYLDQFNEGLVKNKEGKYEYNPSQYKRERDRFARQMDALSKGDKEGAEKIANEDVTSPYDESQVENNKYKTRVNKIRETNEQNAKLNWMVADAYQGDLVNKYMDQLVEEYEKEREESAKQKPTEDELPLQPKTETNVNNTSAVSENKNKWQQTEEKRNTNLAKSREKYERRKAKAKEIYQKNKKKLRRNAYGSIIPALPQLAQAINYLMLKAKTSSYKIAELVSDLKEIVDDIDIDSILPAIKDAYGKFGAKMALLHPEILDNLSSPEELVSYNYQDPTQNLKAEPNIYDTMSDTISNDDKNIIPTISTYYDVFVQTENGVVICKNKEAYDHQNENVTALVQKYIDDLKQNNTSDEAFKQALQKYSPQNFPVDEYVKYRNVEGVEEAALMHAFTFNPTSGIVAGIITRNAVIGILTENPQALKEIQNVRGFDEFVNDIQKLKASLDNAGYRIINTNQMLFDTDKKMSVQADIVCVDKDGNIHVIDVLQSYRDINSRYNRLPGRNAKYTIKDREEQMLHQIEDIFLNKFRTPVKTLSVLPITYDLEHGIIYVQKTNENKINWINVPTKLEIKHNKEDLQDLYNTANDQVQLINQQIDIYNSVVDNLKSDRYQHIDRIIFVEQPSEQLYKDYIEQLTNTYNSIINNINEINDLIQKRDQNKTFDASQDEMLQNQLIIPQEVEDKIGHLSFVCNELDQVLDYIPGIKATTKEEKDNVKKLYQCIFDAQIALDQVLRDPEASKTDVSQEEQLIASAMEKLAENTENFGQMSKFVQKWWLDDFVIGDVNSNTSMSIGSISEKTSAIHNKLNSWVNTFKIHVLEDLQDRPVLQDWYDTLLNVYLNKLVQNSKSFVDKIQDDVVKKLIQDDIQKAEDLIRDFNEEFSMNPDKVYPEAPVDESEALNRISQKWTDLYSVRTSHSPAFDAMYYNDIYFHMSQQPDFLENVTVSFYVSDRDKRYRNKKGFGYDIKKGDVVLFVKYKNNFCDLPLITSSTYHPSSNEEVIARINKINNVNRKFSKIVKKALDIVSKDANKKISFTLSTDRGKIKYDNVFNYHHVSDFLFKGYGNEQDLYTIQTSKENRIGIAVFTINKTDNKMFYDVYAGSDLKTRIGGFDDTFQKQNNNINNGSIIYFYSTGDNQYIGVPIESGKIGQDSAKRLVYLMQQYLQGNKYVDGYDIYDLLSQRLYMTDLENDKKLSVYNNTSNKITLSDGKVIIGNIEYDIQTQVEDVIKAVAAMNNNINAKLLNDNMTLSGNSVFSTTKSKFMNSSVDTITLPNGYIFTRDDFTHQNSNGTKGSTWLGYMLRNGILKTRAIGKSYKQLNIDNFGVTDKNSTINTETKSVVESINNERQDRRKRNFRRLGGLTFNTTTVDERRQMNELQQSVADYFDKIFGSHDFVKVMQKDYLIKLAENQYVLGLCCSDIIKLSQTAPNSVMYHEAFHRIMELLLPDDVREEFYNIYRNKNGKNFSDRKIAEAFADMYMNYMTNKDQIKQAKWYKKPFKWFNQLSLELGLLWKLGLNGGKNIINTFHAANRGEFKGVQISEEKKKRFESLFKEGLHYDVVNKNGKHAEFTNLTNFSDVHEMVKALGYWVANSMKLDSINAGEYRVKSSRDFVNAISQEVIDELCGNNLDDSEIDNIHKAFREVFESKTELKYNKKTKQNYYVKTYPKLDVLLDKINDYIKSTITQYAGEIQEAVEDEDLSDDTKKAMDKNIDQFDKASYESSKLNALPENVKFFLSTVPYLRWNNDENGNKVLDYDYSKNKFACPTFMPMTEVFNTLVNDLHFCSSIEDLDSELKRMSDRREMYKYIYDKFHKIYDQCYKHDENGNVKINYDAESYCASILCALRSLKIDFITSTSKTQVYGKSVTINTSSLERDKRMYSKQWTQLLLSGQVSIFRRDRDKNGNLVFNEGMGGKNNTDIFSRTASLMEQIRNGLTSSNETITVNGTEYNKSVFDDIDLLKNVFIDSLNKIGIIFSKDALDNMLSTKYCGTDIDALTRMFTDKGVDNINSFINRLYEFVNKNGDINTDVINEGYTNIGFVKELGNQFGIYRRNTIESMALGLNGKKLHAVSQNNSISHIVNALNTRDENNPLVHTLMKFGYNITDVNGFDSGSIILKMIRNKQQFNINTHIYIGSKTDNKGDGGTEYKQEPIVDDYMAKMAMIQQDYLIFPTLADKGTWMCLSGIKLPGMRYSSTGGVTNVPTFMWYNGKPYIRPSNEVLDQMLEYAKSERLAIQQCMEDLGYDDIPGYTKQGRKVLDEKDYIKNYHTKNKSIEPNGTRFLSLTEIVELDKDGKPKFDENGKLKFINLNDPRVSSKDLLKLANDNLFEKLEGETNEQFVERQRKIMALTLNGQYELEVQKAIELGIIDRENIVEYGSGQSKETTLIDKNSDNFGNLSSNLLNETQVESLAKQIMEQYPNWNKLPNGPVKQARYKVCRGLAIATLLSDVTTKSIISSQEVFRCFSGHPAEFKVLYGKDHIKDSTFDIQKRIGGMVSTGEDNIENLPGMKRTYTCAECKDYEVKSSSDVFNKLDKMFTDNAVRDMYGILFNNEDKWHEAYDKPIDELLNDKNLTEQQKQALEKAKQNGHRFYESYTSEINVADGAAYITDQMCENLLRLRGALRGNVKKAFDLLRSSDKYTWMDKADAYKTIYDAVNIVTTKYTAYGFRDHTTNGEDVSDVSVAYYNKFALFPLFPCIATGNMNGIYNKMLNEKVDMLFMTSAVKVGSQGAVKYNGESIDEPFNKYEQDYGFLRRQQNTDPEEGDTSSLGTQMVKVVLQNLRLDRNNYVDVETGNKITGKQILSNLMTAINKLTELGYKDVKREFGLNDEGKVVDNKKLSDYLISQLSSRNTSKSLIEALQLDKDGNFKCPLAATQDSSWIESILISTINKKIIDIITPGNSFVQRSVFAIENSQTKGGAILSDKNMAPTINNGNKLQMINEEGSMDAVISIDYFESVLPKDLSFNEAKQFLIKNGYIGGKANTIGYRIPTQAQSSIHALRFVDVIPAVKSTIILPEEFTKITGSDFDIDHLYLASLNSSQDGEILPNTPEYYQNQILNSMLTLLKDTENSMHSLYKSIDNDTDLLTDIAKLIEEQGSNKSRAYNFGTLHEQVTRRNDYITGKFGIGPYALNVTNQVLTRLFGVKFKETPFTKATGICNFDKLIDIDNNYIDSWISAFINAHVDIVKDPYISKMNVNQYTYNMSNLLIRSGYGEAAMWFLAQPIIRDMSNAYNAANSEFMRDQSKYKTVYSAQREAVSNAVLKWLTGNEVSADVINKYTETKKDNFQDQINVVKSILDKKDLLKAIVLNPGKDTVTVNGTSYSVREVQREMFYAWKTLEKYSIALGNLVQRTKIDTKKQGKSFLSIYIYRQKFYDMFYKEGDDSLWDLDSLHNLAENSWIKLKTDLACQLPLQILSNQTFNANQTFINNIVDIYRMLNPDSPSLNTKILESISKDVQTQIKAKYIANYAKEYLGMSDQDITNLFVGNRSMAHRLNMLNVAIRENEKYARLSNNLLIKQIYSAQESEPVIIDGKKYTKPSFISIADNVVDDINNSDMLTEAWEDLLRDNDKFVRKFARDLIVYAYMTSGEYSGWNNLFKYVPSSWIRGEIDANYQSMADYVRSILTSSDFDKYIDIDEIAANNSGNYQYSKRKRVSTGENGVVYNDENISIGSPLNANDTHAPEYITVKNGVYKLQTHISDPINKKLYPIYTRIKKRGYDSGHKQKIYEYGWNFNYYENNGDGLNIDRSQLHNILYRYVMNNPTVFDDRRYNELVKAITDTDTGVNIEQHEVVEKQKDSNLEFNSMSELVMNSGGAHGSDSAWDFYARKAGVVTVNHYRSQDNQVLSPSLNKQGIKATVLTNEELDYAREQEFKLLGIRFENNFVGNLQARNYYQVANSDAVFAIGNILEDNKNVKGGTNTAVQLGIAMNKPVHVFDINTEHWYTYNTKTKQFETEDTPVLTKNFAGVGTRDIENYQTLNKNTGKYEYRQQYVGDEKAKIALKAIQSVFDKTQAELGSNKKQSDDKTLNIYAGTDENTQFSNFAYRPFITRIGTFNTVEGAFQAAKLYYTNDNTYVTNVNGKKALTQEGQKLVNKLKTCSGSEARSIGRNIQNLNTELWDSKSTQILETYMRMSFEQNKQASKLLSETGNKEITHKNSEGIEQDNGRFSSLLTKIRSELQSLLPNSDHIEQHVGDWSREEVQNNPDKLYIFTDNTDRDSGRELIDPNSRYAKKYGQNKHHPKVTQAVIRGLDNAMPLSTQRWYNQTHKGPTGVWKDSDIEEFKKVIDAEISDIMDEWDTGKYTTLVIGDGDAFFNSNISNISITRSPKLYNYLKSKVQQLYKYVDEHPHSGKSKSESKESPITKHTLKQPKQYTQALHQIEKLFILDDKTTTIGENSKKYAIQKLNVIINNSYINGTLSQTDVLNTLYQISKFADKLNNTSVSKKVTVSDNDYNKFKRKIGIIGYSASEVEADYLIEEGEKPGTTDIPQKLFDTVNFLSSFDNNHNVFIQSIFDNVLSQLLGDEQVDLSDVITITDTIEDTRQTDLLKELGMSDEDLKEAEKIKKHCKGGK